MRSKSMSERVLTLLRQCGRSASPMAALQLLKGTEGPASSNTNSTERETQGQVMIDPGEGTRETRTDGVAEAVPRQLLGRENLRRAVPVEGVPHARRVDEGQQVDALPGVALAS